MAKMSTSKWLKFMDDCRYKGRQAFLKGLTTSANPNRLGTHCHNAWEAGFISEQTKHIKPLTS